MAATEKQQKWSEHLNKREWTRHKESNLEPAGTLFARAIAEYERTRNARRTTKPE